MNKKKNTLIVIIIAVIILGAAAAYYVYSRRDTSFHIENHFDDTAFSIDDTDITFREAAYYIMDIEDFVNQQALVYNPDKPLAYWNTHYSAGSDSAFTYTVAKNMVYQVCITDYIYAIEAQENGYSLSDEAIEKAHEEAANLYEDMTDKQHEYTDLSLEDIEKMKERETLATGYAQFLSSQIDWSDTVNSPSTELDYDGDYFQNNILSKYNVKKSKLWDRVSLGKITIN